MRALVWSGSPQSSNEEYASSDLTQPGAPGNTPRGILPTPGAAQLSPELPPPQVQEEDGAQGVAGENQKVKPR